LSVKQFYEQQNKMALAEAFKKTKNKLVFNGLEWLGFIF
jgi:hypothetical protein